MEFLPNWHRIKMRPSKFVRAVAILLARENKRNIET
jgi:hypothetical protein